MKTHLAKIIALAAAASLALGGTTAAAASTPEDPQYVSSEVEAAAASPYFDVTRLIGKDLILENRDCRDLTVTMAHTKPASTAEWSASVGIYRDGSYLGSASFDWDGNVKRSTSFYCPYQGLGRFTLGPTDVWGQTSSGNFFSFDDFTKGSLYVRAKSKAGISVTRSGDYASVKVSAYRFNAASYDRDWVGFSAPKIVLQVKVGDSWKSVVAGPLYSGSATLKYKTTKVQTYRVWIPQTDITTSAISGSRTK